MEINVENGGEGAKRKWKKKKKTFLSNAKKYARKGQLGRGTKMQEDTYQYFVGILEVMKKGVDNEEEKQSLVNNVLDRTRGEEISIVGNQLGCRVVELLLPYSSAEDLERYMEALDPELRRLCADNFSSHVIEKLLVVSCDRATEHLQQETDDGETPAKKVKKEEKYTKEHIKKCYDFTMKIAKYALNNMEDFVFDNYANHILRSAIRCLSGVTLLPGEKLKKNVFKDTTDNEIHHKSIPPHLTKITYKIVPEEFKEIVKEYAQRLSMWPQFKDMPYKNLTSGLLQVLLFAIKNVDKTLSKNIIRKLLDESFAPDVESEDVKEEKKAEEVKVALPPVFGSEPCVRLLEAALFVAKKKTYTQLFARCFIGRLARLVTMPSLNFTVQRLFDNCDVKEELEMMFDEVSGELGAALSAGNTGVLLAVAKACERHRARQTQFVSALESALKCCEPPATRLLPVCCLRLLPADRVDQSGLTAEYETSVHGSLVLQTMLRFQRPTKIASSLLELGAEELLVMLCDARGCHVADAVFEAPFVGAKSRDKMRWKLKGTYQTLAMGKYGSRAFEVIFNTAGIDQKVQIMEEISSKGELLKSSPCGRLLHAKLDVALYRSSPDRWRQRQGRGQARSGGAGEVEGEDV